MSGTKKDLFHSKDIAEGAMTGETVKVHPSQASEGRTERS